VLALRVWEGWESQVKLEEKEKDDVVGRTNGNGIVCEPPGVDIGAGNLSSDFECIYCRLESQYQFNSSDVLRGG
jgi:hypothetical protein